MGDGHDRARVVLEGALEPGHRLGVEVVGRLVEEQEVGLGQQQAAQGHPAALAAGQGGRRRRRPGAAQGVHGDLEGALEVPGAGGVDLVLQLGLLGEELVEVGVGLAHGGAHLVEPVDQLLGLAHPVGDVAEHVLGRVELRLLGQEADGEARASGGPRP